MKDESAEAQLEGFLAKYLPETAAQARAALVRMRRRLPGAVQMVYDNYNALVIGFGPTERASEALFSLAVFPRWVTLCFLRGADLPDPGKLLQGSGKQVRHIVLKDASDLDGPGIQALVASELARAPKPLDGPGRLIIKSISAKQRPRRPAGA